MTVSHMYHLMLRTGLGAAAFAGLFFAPMPIGGKIFLGSAFILIVFSVDAYQTASDRMAEINLEVLVKLFAALDRVSAPSGPTAMQLIEEHLRSRKFRHHFMGEGDF